VKPPDFAYHRASSVAEASAVLVRHGHEAKILAGGQSLIPALNMRLLNPAVLVDINHIEGLGEIDVRADVVRLGAIVRHEQAERSAAVVDACPLLVQALRKVAHAPIRSRGTIVGSLAHADPSAELPAVLALLDGSVSATGPDGDREIPVADFFRGYFETSLRPGELATAATFRRMRDGERTAFVEMARRHGDFALCAVGAVVTDTTARVALAGVDVVPRVFDVSGLVTGDGDADLDALAAGIDPQPDIHASVEYRRHLARELTRQAVAKAAGKA
jgi:carbon-monoxide dehydrogenase medium subunit